MVKDIILDDKKNYDLLIKNSDFVVSESDQQHQVLIINTYFGDWKQYPLQGVGIVRFIGSSGQSEFLKREITLKLQSDGFTVNKVTVNPNNPFEFTIDAERI